MGEKKSLLVIGTNCPAPGAGLVHQVLQFWPVQDRPSIQIHSTNAILRCPSLLDQGGVAWLVIDQNRDPDLYDLIGLLQDRHVPTILTRPQESKPMGAAFSEGVVTAPPNGPPACIAAMLRALWCQADVVQVLKSELSLLQLQHGGVVDRFDKIDEELRLAAQFQRAFLPASLPNPPGLKFSVLFRPTGHVSGDIYDVTTLNDEHVGFFLADAVGHGAPAALMTVYIKSSLTVRGLDDPARRSIVVPSEALARLNRDLIDYQRGQMRTATAVFGVLNTKTLELQIARAGHPYPLLLRRDGSSTAVKPEGAMLGVFPDATFDLLHLQLEPGDRLVLFSDGFELAFPEDVQEPSARHVANRRYLKEFEQLAHGPVDTAIDRLAAKLDRQIGSLNSPDDMTVLLVAATGDDSGREALRDQPSLIAGSSN